jgi:signal transduction histidine kinase
VVETALFRIVQEALANAAKHGHARHVQIRLSREGMQILLQVSDDGQGFDPAAPRAATHVGLWSMQERAIQLRGEARIESAPGQGTRITITLPAAGRSPAEGEAREQS